MARIYCCGIVKHEMESGVVFEAAVGNPSIERVKVRVLPDERLSRKDAAAYLGRAVKTLVMWHTAGTGPVSVLVGGRRFYFKGELDRFISQDTPSSER